MNPNLNLRASVNPYRFALRAVLDRLKWDLTVESWRSRARLKSLKDQHYKEKAVIVCNGPSLLNTDLDSLKDVYCFGLNKINLLFEKSAFRPSCVVAINSHVIQQNKEFYESTELPLYLDSRAVSQIKRRDGVTFLHAAEQPKFARNCSISIQTGYTVTFVAMQLAFHMGFRRVALIGCDHSFAVKGVPNETVTAGAKDDSHFDPNYFSQGVKWQLPDLVASEFYYSKARDVFAHHGGEITNCTNGGQLEIFRRSRLDHWLKEAA